MGKFIVVSFLMLGWAFYELSGGADFVPETRPVAMAEAPEAEPIVEEPVALVTRAATSNVTIAPEVPAVEVVEVVATAPEMTDDTYVDVEEVAAAVEEAIEEAPALAPLLDMRAVAGSRVNMRAGPGTSFDVLVTLPQGTETEVLEVNADGWAKIRVLGSGATGWMAERLLSEI